MLYIAHAEFTHRKFRMPNLKHFYIFYLFIGVLIFMN